MLDIRRIRENPEAVKERLALRDPAFAGLIDEVLACDSARRALETRLQGLNADRKRISKEIGGLRARGENTDAIQEQVREIGEEIGRIDLETKAADERQISLLLQIPNTPHAEAPVGQDESANPELRVWGEKPAFDFDPKDHVALAASLGLVDFERAAKISGSGFAVYTGAGARLERALIGFLLDLHSREHGYTEVAPPYLIKRDCMFGTGQLPKFEDDMYGLEENQLFLAPTAEVPVTNLHREELLSHTDLPIRYTACTPCFRREAGSAGRDSRGLIRMHQFNKVELVQIVHPEQSYAVLEELTEHAEKVLQLLGLHYRVIELCTGDVGFSAAKTYDIEVWAPGQGCYLEVSSCSNFEDYQARRMNLRFKDAEGKNRVPHTLNGSGTALPRLYVALLETYQQADGTIRLPEALHPYMGADRVG